MGEEASLRRCRNKEHCERRRAGRLCFKPSRGGAAAPKNQIKYADVAESADALDSGSSESNFIWVQVPSSAPKIKRGSLSPSFDFLYKLNT